MSVTDPVVPQFYAARGTWILVHGRETFYDEADCLREWETLDEALAWGYAHLPAYVTLLEEPDWPPDK